MNAVMARPSARLLKSIRKFVRENPGASIHTRRGQDGVTDYTFSKSRTSSGPFENLHHDAALRYLKCRVEDGPAGVLRS